MTFCRPEERCSLTKVKGAKIGTNKLIFLHHLGERPVDSLQLMIEAADGPQGKKLTDAEITGNAFVFILAG